jgi:hypothetical protein
MVVGSKQGGFKSPPLGGFCTLFLNPIHAIFEGVKKLSF